MDIQDEQDIGSKCQEVVGARRTDPLLILSILYIHVNILREFNMDIQDEQDIGSKCREVAGTQRIDPFLILSILSIHVNIFLARRSERAMNMKKLNMDTQDEQDEELVRRVMDYRLG